MINGLWTPNIYLNWKNPTTDAHYLINYNYAFPEDEFKCDTNAQNCEYGGGWDGALVDLFGNPYDPYKTPDLVIAQGGGEPAEARLDAVYHWKNDPSADPPRDMFVHSQDIEPGIPPEEEEEALLRFVTRGVAAGDLNDDDCVDLVFAYEVGWNDDPEVNDRTHGGLQIFFNEEDEQVCTGEFFLASQNAPSYEYWEYNVLPALPNPPPEGMRNPDGPMDGIIVDLFEDGVPQILIVGDGQNRLLVREDFKFKYSGMKFVPPPPEGDGAGSRSGGDDFLMMTGLTGLAPADLALFFDPNWLPALPEFPTPAE